MAVALVQTFNTGLTSVASPQTVNFTNNITAGNFLIFSACNNAGSGSRPLTFTDGPGDTFTVAVAGGLQYNANGDSLWCSYAANSAGGSKGVTLTWTGGATSWNIICREYSGIVTTSPADGTYFNSNTGTGTTASANPAGTTSQSPDLLISLVAMGSSGTITSAGGSWVNLIRCTTNAGFNSGMSDQENVGSGVGPAATYTTSNNAWGIMTFAFKGVQSSSYSGGGHMQMGMGM